MPFPQTLPVIRAGPTRDMAAAKRFFAQTLDVVGHAPIKVTTDGHDSYPRAIRETLGPDVAQSLQPILE